MQLKQYSKTDKNEQFFPEKQKRPEKIFYKAIGYIGIKYTSSPKDPEPREESALFCIFKGKKIVDRFKKINNQKSLIRNRQSFFIFY